MEVTREREKFNPITIILESQEEFNALIILLNTPPEISFNDYCDNNKYDSVAMNPILDKMHYELKLVEQ